MSFCLATFPNLSLDLNISLFETALQQQQQQLSQKLSVMVLVCIPTIQQLYIYYKIVSRLGIQLHFSYSCKEKRGWNHQHNCLEFERQTIKTLTTALECEFHISVTDIVYK